MQPVAVFQSLLKVNRPVAIFLLAGCGLLALSVIALNFMGNMTHTLTTALWILGLAFVVSIMTFVVNNKLLRTTLCWTFFGFFVLFLLGFVDAALQLSGRLPPPVCYLRMFVQDRASCEAQNVPRQLVENGAVSRVDFREQAVGLIWRVQAAETIPPRATAYDQGPIYVQVSPGVEAAEAEMAVSMLIVAGWPTVSGIGGIEYVASGPSDSEVRYFHAGDAVAALELAQALKIALPGHPVYVADFSQSGLIAPAGQLEIWISPVQTSG
jgi:hypothetical protein